MKRRVFSITLAACILIAGHVSAQQLLDLQTPSARTSAIGGRHAALTDNLNTLFSNPAGFQAAGPEMSVAELTLGLTGPVFDIAGIVVEASQSGDISSLLGSENVQSVLQGLYASMNLLGPVSFGYVGNGLGFGIFNTTGVTFTNSKALTISATISERLTLAGGYAFRIPFPEESKHTLDIGLLLKGILEGQFEIEKSFLELPTLFESISLETLTGEPFHFITAIGVDAGIKYSYNNVLHAGLTGINIFTPALVSSYSSVNTFIDGSETPVTTDALYPVEINAGIMFTPKMGSFRRYISGLAFLLDYNDIFDFLLHPATSRHPILHISAGMEIELLSILSLRVGMNDGLLAAGVGMDLNIFTLNAAMYGTELSSEPGLNPVYNITLGFEFRLDKIGK